MKKFFIISVVISFIFCQMLAAHDFDIWSNLTKSDTDEVAKKMAAMGVMSVWYNTGFPVEKKADGKPQWSSIGAKDQIFKTLDILAKHEIKAFLLLNTFYKTSCDGERQHDRWGIPVRYRSFTTNYDEMLKLLEFYISELKSHPAFGGIVLDDEPGFVAGGDISPETVKSFANPVPKLQSYLNNQRGLVPNDDLRVLWFEYQKETVKKYYGGLYNVLHKRYPDLRFFVIPAAPYFSGLQLSVPGGNVNDFFAKGRRVTLADDHIKKYRLYVQYYIAPLSLQGWDRPVASGLWVAMMPNGLPQFCPKPIFAFSKAANGGKTLSPVAFKRFILQTFAEGNHGVVFSPTYGFNKDLYKTGAEVFQKYIKPLREKLPNLKPLPPRVAIFYSDTTRAIADIWGKNPLERYRQIHFCQALAYYLMKRGIPFEILTEREIQSGERKLEDYEFVIFTGITNITEKTATMVRRYIETGGKLVADKESGKIFPAAIMANFDASCVYDALVDNVMTPDILEYQAGILSAKLDKILPQRLAPAVSSSRKFNMNYLTDGKDTYLFIVNDDLYRKVSSKISFRTACIITDVLERKTSDTLISEIDIKIPPGEMKVFKLEKKGVLRE